VTCLRVAAIVLASCACLLPRSVSADDEVRAPAQTEPTKYDIQHAAQRVEAARRGEKSRDGALPQLGTALRALQRALADVASPRSPQRASNALAVLTQSAGEFRARCEAVGALGARDASMARVASDLTSRCALLLSGVDAVVARPAADERAAGAAELLSELAAAGPKDLDPRRATHEPTMRAAE
jgi:hypothetical protein